MEHFPRFYPETFNASHPPKIIKPEWTLRSLEGLPPAKLMEELPKGPLCTVTLPFLVLDIEGKRGIVSGVRSIGKERRITGLGGGVTNYLGDIISERIILRKKPLIQSDIIILSLLREIYEEGLYPLDPGIQGSLAEYWKTHHPSQIPDAVRFIKWKRRRRIIVDALFFPPREPFNISYSDYIRLRPKASPERTGRVFFDFWETKKAFDQLIKGLRLSIDLLNKSWEEAFPHLIKIAQELYQNGLEIEGKIYRFGFTPADAVVYVIELLRLFTFSHEERPPSLPKIIFQEETGIATADTSLWDYWSGRFRPNKVKLTGYRIPLSNGNGPFQMVISQEFLQVVGEIYSSLEKIQNVLELGKKASKFFKTDLKGFLNKVIGYSHFFPKRDYGEDVFLEKIRKYLKFIENIFERVNGKDLSSEKDAFSLFISGLTSSIVYHLQDLGININVSASSIEEFRRFLEKAKEALKGYLSSEVEDNIFYAILWLITFAPLTEAVFAGLFRKIIERPGGLKKLTPYVIVFPPFSPTVESFYPSRFNRVRWHGVQHLFEIILDQETKV